MCNSDRISISDLKHHYNEKAVSVGFDKMISRMCQPGSNTVGVNEFIFYFIKNVGNFMSDD